MFPELRTVPRLASMISILTHRGLGDLKLLVIFPNIFALLFLCSLFWFLRNYFFFSFLFFQDTFIFTFFFLLMLG